MSQSEFQAITYYFLKAREKSGRMRTRKKNGFIFLHFSLAFFYIASMSRPAGLALSTSTNTGNADSELHFPNFTWWKIFPVYENEILLI